MKEQRKEQTKILHAGYEIIMSILALAAISMLVIEMTSEISEFYLSLFVKIDLAIISVFAIDYIIRFIISKDKLKFFKSNLFDLVAILPFDKVFRIARVVRLTRFIRLSKTSRFMKLLKLGRITLLLKRFGKEILKLLKTNGLHYVILFTFGLIFCGALLILMLEQSYGNITTFGEALWWSLVTTTTVGYGDLSPVSAGGRIVAAVLMLVGIGFIGMVTGSIATFFIKKTKKENDCENTKPDVIDISNLTEKNKENLLSYIRYLKDTQEKET